MELRGYLDELERQGQALGSAAAQLDLDAEVPTCPTWTVAELVAHIGMVHRWAASHVQEPRKTGDGAQATAPEEGLLDWYDDGHRILVETLRSAQPDVAAWTFLPARSPLEFWARRQAHETAIHRADADAARGCVPSYDADFAADGIAELIDGFMGRRGGRLLSDRPRTLKVRLADNDRSWHMTIGPEGRQISHDATMPAEATVLAAASQMYLFLWNRVSRDVVQVNGDSSVLDLWRDKAHVRWS
ncbi:MAG: maleylpyruvate isomerase family mycothiol-dependent enzyme [Actinomycetota bacterium]|nr:maleylpyruvate isomerase family mycothiol-dependent enzyme [Actinomycetota bacterium]